jgi:hypothetical protein
MSTCSSTLEKIRNLEVFLSPIPQQDRKSAVAEFLISEAVSYMFHLEFYNSKTDRASVEHKVVWNGYFEKNDAYCGSNTGADTNVYAREFDVLVEVTRRDEANQWKLEFASGLRHMEQYIAKTVKPRDQVHLFLVAPKIHVDTYNSIRQKQIEGQNILPLTFIDIAHIAEVCNITIGLRHVDLSNLFDSLGRAIQKNETLDSYEKVANDIIGKWRKTFLQNDKLAFLGIKGYKVFREKGQDMMTASDILTELNTLEDVKLYSVITEDAPKRDDVRNGMLTFGFAYESGYIGRDTILSVASESDIEKRMSEILESIK